MTGSLAIKHLWLGKEKILIIHIGKWVLINRVISLLEEHLSSFGLFADNACLKTQATIMLLMTIYGIHLPLCS
jgi:hypothetical protein